MPNSRFALHGLAHPKFTLCALFLPLIHGLCAFFRPLLDSPLLANLSVHGLHFTVHAPSIIIKHTQVHPNFGLSSPHRSIAIAMMLASWPTSQWISAARAQIAVKTHRIAKVIFCDAHSTAQIACFGPI